MLIFLIRAFPRSAYTLCDALFRVSSLRGNRSNVASIKQCTPTRKPLSVDFGGNQVGPYLSKALENVLHQHRFVSQILPFDLPFSNSAGVQD